jgi:hypothetical protein
MTTLSPKEIAKFDTNPTPMSSCRPTLTAGLTVARGKAGNVTAKPSTGRRRTTAAPFGARTPGVG